MDVHKIDTDADALDLIHAAVLANEGAGDQLQIIYEILEQTGRKVP